jgi:hypothetical protein
VRFQYEFCNRSDSFVPAPVGRREEHKAWLISRSPYSFRMLGGTVCVRCARGVASSGALKEREIDGAPSREGPSKRTAQSPDALQGFRHYRSRVAKNSVMADTRQRRR